MLSCTVKYTQNNCYVVGHFSLGHHCPDLTRGAGCAGYYWVRTKWRFFFFFGGGGLLAWLKRKMGDGGSCSTSRASLSESWLSLVDAFHGCLPQCFPSVLNLKGFCKKLFLFCVLCYIRSCVFMSCFKHIFMLVWNSALYLSMMRLHCASLTIL